MRSKLTPVGISRRGVNGVEDKHFASQPQASWGKSHTVTETRQIKYLNRLSSVLLNIPRSAL